MTLEIDFETRSDVDIKTRGVYVYMASPHTAPLMASWRIDGGPIRRWRPPAPCPGDIVAHVAAGGTISAHNAQFERLLWQMVLTPRHGWPAVRTAQFRCTAATAAAMALPRALGDLGAALGLDVLKDKAGAALIRKFSVPRRARKGEPDGLHFNDPADHPEDFERFHDYCDTDVLTEAAADARMVPLSADEQDLWVLDQQINDRGIRIDRRSARAALALADTAKRQLDAEMKALTGGAVATCNQVARLVEWINGQGVDATSAAKADLDDLLVLTDLPASVRKAIELRQEAAKTSVSKLRAMLARASDDGRIRGTNIYHGASTGRWTSVGVNFNNLPRPRKVYEDAELDRRVLFDAFRRRDPTWLRFLYGDDLGRPLHLIADALRSFVWAAPGHELVVADYSGIEGAVAAWFADEGWKVEALREIAADPKLPDMYMRTAAAILGLPVETVTKKHWARQAVGKVAELALGYQGGVSAFHSFARIYGVDLDPLYGPVWETATPEQREKAERRYEGERKRGRSKTDVLSREAWIACEIVKTGWRQANAEIAATWNLLEDAIRAAVREPGRQAAARGRATYLVRSGFLWCRLPSGRCLAYGSPRLKDQVWAKVLLPDGTWSDAEVMDRDAAEAGARKGTVRIEGTTSPAVTALGVDSVTKKWRRFALYGGLAFENVVQAIARDLLVNGMRKAEGAGYPIIHHVYDEIVTEVPRGFGDVGTFEALICDLPGWAEGLPLTAHGYRAKRYRKD